ncbi:MAG: fumarylacetoacetate hydrolase family protein [Anaerolineae bacterium]|nr:fumarylacetoacetate hydrolase family protein [Anaerolineae bacterium]
MKLVTFHVDGLTQVGVLNGDQVTAVGFSGDMNQFIAAGMPVEAGGPSYNLSQVRLLAPIPRPGKFLALAGNYQAHIEEGGGKRVDKTKITPRVFMKPSSCVVGPGEAVQLPRVSDAVDYELELGIVIGRQAKHVSVDQALDYVAGYTIINDISSRSLNIGAHRTPRPMDDFFDWLNGKWQDSFGPMGPYILTADEVADPDDLDLKLSVNGVLRQNSNTGYMIFNTREMVAFCSDLMTLEPGDVIATGTPSGVGDTTGTYLKAGDVMRGEVEGLGVLESPVVGG